MIEIVEIEKIIDELSEINIKNLNGDSLLGCIIENAIDIDKETNKALEENRNVSDLEKDFINDAALRILFGVVNFLKLQEITDKRLDKTKKSLIKGISQLEGILDDKRFCYEKMNKLN